jgi:hypothetical protein
MEAGHCIIDIDITKGRTRRGEPNRSENGNEGRPGKPESEPIAVKEVRAFRMRGSLALLMHYVFQEEKRL